MSEEVNINGIRCRVLFENDASECRNAFVTNQEAVAGIDKLAKLIGKEAASQYFERVYYNLKYELIE